QRLDRALDRVEQRSRAPVSGSDWRGALERLAEHFRAPRFLDHLASRTGDRVHLVPVDHVAYVQARERATYAVTATAEHMLDATLAELERKLDPATFFRIHRATLVNVAWVGELHAHFGGRLAVRLKGERRDDLVVSRDRVRPLKERLGLA
ncbi:MAG: LytTR family transcriptional regulator, partial [Candidatus Rokubacteria bacterium]|nr:LytTR family transcriptional regulator [Candidatus Rokubacteria bacterium]